VPRYAVGLPNVGPFADARMLVDMAVAAEERGWDGVVATFADAGRTVPVPVEDFAQVVQFVTAERGSLAGFDVGLEGWTTPDDAADVIDRTSPPD
jgi:hypothetical protein